MAKYVYPIFERESGMYYGVHTCLKEGRKGKTVATRLAELIKDREERAACQGGTITHKLDEFQPSHDGDVIMKLQITITSKPGKTVKEIFVVHRSIIH